MDLFLFISVITGLTFIFLYVVIRYDLKKKKLELEEKRLELEIKQLQLNKKYQDEESKEKD